MKKLEILKQPAGIAAVSAAISGVLIHMFGLVTILHNYDDVITHPQGFGTGLPLGRWFLEILGTIVEGLSFGYNLSWVNGLALLALIALSAGFLADALGLKCKKTAVLFGMLMVSFPTVVTTMIFNFTAPYYGVSLFLAVFAVWVLPKHKFGFVASVVCIACSMGIYQAYVPVTIAMFVMILLKKLLDEDASILDLLKQGVFDCLILAAGLILYFIILKIAMAAYDGELSSYQGISEMGQMNLKELVKLVIKSVKGFYRIPFFDNYTLAQIPALRLCYGLAYSLTFILIWAVLLLKKKSILEILAAGALWLVFPVAVNFITVMTPQSYIYSLMVYPFVLVFCLPSLLAEWMPELSGIRKKLKNAAIRLTAAVLILVVTYYAYWANVNYTALFYANRQAENYMNALFTQVRMTEGFDTEKDWAFLGEIEDPLFYSWWDKVPIYGGNSGRMSLLNGYSGLAWPVVYFGYAPPLATDETLAALKADPQVQAMPCWPNEGSIAVVGENIVIKFQN